MALEAVVFQQDPFIYGCKDYNYINNSYGFELQPQLLHEEDQKPNIGANQLQYDVNGSGTWEYSPPASSSVVQNATSSPETCAGGRADRFFPNYEATGPVMVASRRKRRRTKSMKNKEEMENQRMTHIAVERNRRRQMNDYLAVLRSLMPPSYAQRGDQASIVGGAINYVKELEQLLQFLEAHKLPNQRPPNANNVFSNFFTFPQYSTCPSTALDAAVERQSGVADIEVTMAESHANIKILTKRRSKQLLKMVAGLQSIGLTILHLNITTVDKSVLYSFSVKVEDECHLTTVNEIATAVHDMVVMIQEEPKSST